jgi:hypothetical protein
VVGGKDLGAAFEGLALAAEGGAGDDGGGGGGFYPAAAVEDGERLAVRVSTKALRFGPPGGYRAVAEAMRDAGCHGAPGKPHPAAAPAAPEPEPAEEKAQGGASSTSTSTSTSSTSTSTSAAEVPPAPPAAALAAAPAPAPAAPTAPVMAEALDLAGFSGPGALAALGLDRLKAALMACGAKCGGTLDQRAERLWLCRGSKGPADLDPSLRAGAPAGGGKKPKL